MAVGWATLAEVIPLYPLYALLFAHTGLSEAQISALFTIWAIVGLVAEVPSGALADRFARRWALVGAGVLQAVGYALWVAFPGFTAFAAGFAIWALGGALSSGAFEALLYDGLAAAGAESHYARIQGRVAAAELLAQLPAAAAATALFSAGGYPLVGWVSIGLCLCAALLASRLPEPPRRQAAGGAVEARYLDILRSGVCEAAASPPVRFGVIAVAALGGLDAIEEYFPLLAAKLGVSEAWIPLILLVIPALGAVGAGLGGVANRLRSVTLGLILALALATLALAGVVKIPLALAAIALFYGLYRMVLVVADARLQERIEGQARATVTSASAVGTEIAGTALFGAWAVGGISAVVLLWFPVALMLPFWLGKRPAQPASSPTDGRQPPASTTP